MFTILFQKYKEILTKPKCLYFTTWPHILVWKIETSDFCNVSLRKDHVWICFCKLHHILVVELFWALSAQPMRANMCLGHVQWLLVTKIIIENNVQLLTRNEHANNTMFYGCELKLFCNNKRNKIDIFFSAHFSHIICSMSAFWTLSAQLMPHTMSWAKLMTLFKTMPHWKFVFLMFF